MIFLLITIFVVSFGTILFELTLTRIFSIILWYDYAFMAISIAFFGLGIGAITVYISKSKAKIDEEKHKETDGGFIPSRIVQSSLTFAISIPIFLFIIAYILPPNINFIYLFYLASSIPFFFAGMTMALIYTSMPKEISKLYFVDLGAAAIATLILDPFMQKLGAESTLLSLAVIVSAFSVAALLFLLKSGHKTKGSSKQLLKIGNKTKSYVIIVLAVTTIITVVNIYSFDKILSIQPGESKGLHYKLADPSVKLLATVWNSFSRVDVLQNSSIDLSKDRKLASILIDADASTDVQRWNGSVSDLQWLRGRMEYLPYDILGDRSINNTLVVGSGGGDDVLVALVGGSKKVTAVEINPSVVSEAKKFGKLAGNLFERTDVDLFIDDGRRFISSSISKYDIIIIRLVDSWAAQLAGGYALSENYLYTVEAFRDYLQHLDQNNGLLSMVRWNIELPRLMPLLIESLRQEEAGKTIDEIARQIVVIENCREPGRCNDETAMSPVLVLVKNSPFNNSELNIIKNKVAKNNAKIIAMAGQIVQPPYDSLLSTNNSDENSHLENTPTNNNPSTTTPNWQRPVSGLKLPTDDSPFYFAKELVPKQMITLLETILILSAVLTAILIYYSRINRIQKNGHIGFHILFVILIGLGFIFLEITFIQKFLLLLGTPILALTVILFSILLSTGIGSYLSGRLFAKEPFKAIAVSIPILVGIVLAYYILLQEIIYSNIILELPQRIALTLALLFPVGIVMGFQFPSIIRMAYSPPQLGSKAEQSDKEKNTVITLLWGVNVIASVVGTVVTVISSMIIGFSGNLLIAAGFYMAALCSVVFIRQSEKLHIVTENM
jgi:predicted membrane-bound spermidine synthase